MEKRIIKGTKDNQWHLIDSTDRDFDSAIPLTNETFKPILESWLIACQGIVNKHYNDNYPNQQSILEIKIGKKYAKVISRYGARGQVPISGSVWAFVDITNGNVLKAAGWSTPAKHARGNLFDANQGLGWMGVHGPAYLR